MTITIVIVSRNRKQTLDKCLFSISQQFRQPDEVIVVENNNCSTYQEVKQKYKCDYYLVERISIPYVRNFAISKAVYFDVICFVDDDRLLSPSWLKEIEIGFKKNKESVLQLGKTVNMNEKNLFSIFEQQIYDRWLSMYFDLKKMNILNSGIFVDTKNLAIKTRFLKRANIQFDLNASFKSEDTDFGIRLFQKLKKNEHFLYNPSAVLQHQNNSTIFSFIKKRFLEGREKKFLENKHGNFQLPVKMQLKSKKNVLYIFHYLAKVIQVLGYYSYN